MWRSRRWRRLLNLIDGLPRASHLRHELAQDEEVARQQAENIGPNRLEASISFADWTPEVELLSLLVDLTGEHLAFTAAVNSKDRKVKHPIPMPRPKRALDAVLRRLQDELADALIEEVEQAQRRGNNSDE